MKRPAGIFYSKMAQQAKEKTAENDHHSGAFHYYYFAEFLNTKNIFIVQF